MSPALLAVLGTAAALVSMVDVAPYVRDVLRGATRPHRGTWLIWSALGVLVLGSQAADGATWSLGMVAVQAVTTFAVFVLSIRHGEGGVSRTNLAMITLAALGIAGWFVADDPTIATVCVVFADCLGVALMLPKTWRDPDSETLVTYALATAAGALSALAVGGPRPALLVYPLYYVAGNGVIAAVILRRRRALGTLEPAAAAAVR